MSPWRDVPHPVYVPSFLTAGSLSLFAVSVGAGCGAGVGEGATGAAATGAAFAGIGAGAVAESLAGDAAGVTTGTDVCALDAIAGAFGPLGVVATSGFSAG